MNMFLLSKMRLTGTVFVPLVLLMVADGILNAAFADAPFAKPPAWPRDRYVRQLVQQVLPETSEDWDGYKFAQRGSRGATYIAAGLLWRDGNFDRDAAASVLTGVLDLQYEDGPKSKRYGVWRRRQGESNYDSNWRAFVGCGLILILESFPDRIPTDLVYAINAALLRAAQGSARRDVGAGYTNIALMSAFLLDYVGSHQRRGELQKAGREKAEEIYELFNRHKTFHEYNSPTYYGVNLMALALWREHACSDRMRALGGAMEADLWRDIGMFYHAEMQNLCGPFVRAYGMDMTQYCSLAGLWIALAVGDPASSPWPTTGGRHQGERIYGPVFAILRPQVPADVMPHLKRFVAPRQFERMFGDAKATVRIDKDLMLGGARLRRRWEQHHPATIYWLPGDEPPVGWILLTGLNETIAPEVTDRSMRIRRIGESNEPIQFLLWAPGIDQSAIAADRWKLPGLRVAVERTGDVSLENVRWNEHGRYGRCLEVRYSGAAKNAAIGLDLSLRSEN
ncbi:MAG: hypothetical protein ACODAD_08485 [Planctomycetota bacterium]